MAKCLDDRLATVNQVLAKIAPGTIVIKGCAGWDVEWFDPIRARKINRRWAAHELYPVWHRRWGHGGTCCTALTMLMRWLQDRPVFGISTWEYWLSPTINLAKGDPGLIPLLKAGGYPQEQMCIRCGQEIPKGRGLDWWSLDGKSGPACSRSWTCDRRQGGGDGRS